MTESTSSGALRGSETFGTRRMPKTSMAAAIGSMTQNSPRQCTSGSRNPEIVGPTAGATDMTIEIRPIIRPRDCGGTSDMMVVIMSGIMIAVPDACTTRPRSRTPNPGAVAAISVPAVNRLMAVMNTGGC